MKIYHDEDGGKFEWGTGSSPPPAPLTYLA